jgi:HSP20 family protein
MVEKTHDGGFWPSLYDPFRSFGTRVADWLAPMSDAKSSDDGYRITMELPGVEEDDIHLSVEAGLVTVKGEKKTEREDKGDTWYFSERQYGSFQRAFRLPPDADDAAVKAGLKDGVLTIQVPRKPAPKFESTRVKINRD